MYEYMGYVICAQSRSHLTLCHEMDIWHTRTVERYCSIVGWLGTDIFLQFLATFYQE